MSSLDVHGCPLTRGLLLLALLGAASGPARAHRPQEALQWKLERPGNFIEAAQAVEPVIVDESVARVENGPDGDPLLRNISSRLDKLDARILDLEKAANVSSRDAQLEAAAPGGVADDESQDEVVGASEGAPELGARAAAAPGHGDSLGQGHGHGSADGHKGVDAGDPHQKAHLSESYLDFFNLRSWSDDEVKIVATTTALLLLFFMAFIMCIIYMLNFPDPQVKSLSFKLVSSCIAILCAVLLEKAQFGQFSKLLIIGTILGEDDHSLRDQLEMMSVNMVFYLIWVSAMSVFMKRNRSREMDLYSIKLFLTHEIAFVGIHMLSHPMEELAYYTISCGWQPFMVKVFQMLYVVGVGAFCFCVFGITSLVRSQVAYHLHESEEHQSEARDHGDEQHHGHRSRMETWMVEANDGEGESAAILLSLLTRQVVLLAITGRVPNPKGDFGFHTRDHFGALLGTIIVFMAVLLVVTKMVESKIHHGQHHVPTVEERACEFTVSYLAFLVGWLGLSLCRWLMQKVIREKTLMFIGVAAWVSFPLIMLIIAVDFLCDEGWLLDATALVFIECSGLMIGISWEKAFAMAINTINHAHSGSTSSVILTEMGLCVGLCLLLLPGWRWYIVPVAHLPVPPRHQDGVAKAPWKEEAPHDAQDEQGQPAEAAGAGRAPAGAQDEQGEPAEGAGAGQVPASAEDTGSGPGPSGGVSAVR